MSARGKAPGRSSTGRSRQAMMVDSSPMGVGPPSTISSMRPRRSASTCWAVVGETCPERLAGGGKARERARGVGVGDVGDEGIERRAALGVIKACDGLAVGGVGPEPVDGLGRKGDEAAPGERARRACDGGRVGRDRAFARLYHL